ncbi:hypothetical protein MSPP1_004032 [Malassezia sp. CBS 17886]|nr:hypothetical protein MSPP1_004032 [Malassezia sp. CBS 17886]
MDTEKASTLGSDASDGNVATPPNGGFFAWLQVAGAFFFLFNTSGIVNSFGVFQTYYEGKLSQGSSAISWIGSVQGFLMLFVGVLTGPLFDAGFFRVLSGAGLLLVVVGLMMTSLTKEYWQVFLAQGICIGLGGACLFVPGVAICSTYFSTKRSLAIGVTASGSSIGAVVYSIAFYRLVQSVGFGWSTRILGFIALATLIFSNAVLRPRLGPATRRSLFAFSALRELSFCLLLLGILLGYMGAYVPYYYISLYASARTGMDEELAFYMIAVINAASALGRILPNLVADSVGPLNVLIPFAGASTVLGFAWLGVQNTGGLIVFSILYGFVTGAYVSLPPATVASLTKDLHQIGARVGMCFMMGGIGMLIGNPIAGALVDTESGTYWKAQVYCGACLAGSTAAFVLSRATLVGWGWKKV